jgi:hypothetical protein
MNIGTQTNSLVNHLYSRATIDAPAPFVGQAATTLSWTDRHAATVTEVETLKSKLWSYEIRVTQDRATVVSGSAHDGSAVFEFAPNSHGYSETYRQNRKTGTWFKGYINHDTGNFKKGSGGLILGRRDHYVDPHF